MRLLQLGNSGDVGQNNGAEMIAEPVRKTQGFTVIELLIVVAVVALLVSIAAPAVLAVLGRSEGAVCQSNLKQFGTAFQAFVSTNNGEYPSGLTLRTVGPVLPEPEIKVHSYMTELISYLEVESAAREFDLGEHFLVDENAAAIASPLTVARCPSAPQRSPAASFSFVPSQIVPATAQANPFVAQIVERLDAKYSKEFHGALTDYAVIAWIDHSVPGDYGLAPTTNWGLGIEGMFPYPVPEDYKRLLADLAKSILENKPIELSKRRHTSELHDGAANTIMMIEAAGRPERWEHGQRTKSDEPVKGGAWADFRNLMEIKGAGGDNKCLLSCDNRDGPYSFHPGIVNTLFADGHVDALATDMDGRVFISLVSVHGGDNVTSAE